MTQTPPHAVETEKSLLGAILLDGQCYGLIKDLIHPESFYRPNHGLIFSAMQEVYKKSTSDTIAIDITTVAEQLQADQKLQDIGGQGYLIELGETSPSSANVEYYAKVVAEKKTLRDIQRLGAKTNVSAGSIETRPEELLSELKGEISKIESRVSGKKVKTVADSTVFINETIDEKIKSGKKLQGIATGLESLDKYIKGWKRGCYHVVGARQGTGKTTLVWNSLRFSAEQGVPSALLSLEMPELQLLNKSVSDMTGIPLSFIEDYPEKLSERSREKINIAIARLKEIPLYIDSSKDIHLSTNIFKSINHLVREKGVQIIAIDHVSRITNGTEKRYGKKHEFYVDFSHEIDKLAEELNFALILISQINPPVNRTNPRPIAQDIRETQAIQDDADIIILPHRPEKTYLQENKKASEVPMEIKGLTEIFVAKNRGGDEGMFTLHFDGAVSRFSEIDRTREAPPEPINHYGRDAEEMDF